MSKKRRRRTAPRTEAPSPAVEEKAGSWRQPRTIVFLLLALAVTCAVYLPSLGNGLTNWDDPFYVTDSALIRGLTFEHLKAMFTTNVRSNYHPITMLSLAVNYRFTGLDPMPYHLTNLVIHLLNTALVFWIVFEWSRRRLEVAVITAVVFGIHPMHVESVAWVSERKDVLYTFFFLLAMVAFRFYVIMKKPWLYGLSLCLFVLSLLSKSAAVVLPVVLLLVDWLENRKLSWTVLLEKIPFFGLSLLFGIVAVITQSEVAIGDFGTYTILQRVMFASYGFLMYLARFVVPLKLSAFYPFPDMSGGGPLAVKLAPVAVITLFALALWSLCRTRLFVFGLFFYLVTVALVLQFVTVGGAVAADRYTYVPYIGVAFILGSLCSAILRKGRGVGAALVVGLLVYGAMLGKMTLDRCRVWANSEVLWTDVINKYPTVPYAHNNRGQHYHSLQEWEKAYADYNRAIELKTNYLDALNNRGLVHHYGFGRNEEALADFNRAIALRPNSVSAYRNRGRVHGALGNYDQAIADYGKALELNPNHADTYNNRGTLLFNKKRAYQRALEDFDRAIGLDGSKGLYYLNRSRCYYLLGNKARALEEARRGAALGVEVDPEYLASLESDE